jgi:hypothetical protein
MKQTTFLVTSSHSLGYALVLMEKGLGYVHICRFFKINSSGHPGLDLIDLPGYQNGKNIPNDHNLCQTDIIYNKWPLNIPNDHKIGI